MTSVIGEWDLQHAQAVIIATNHSGNVTLAKKRPNKSTGPKGEGASFENADSRRKPLRGSARSCCREGQGGGQTRFGGDPSVEDPACHQRGGRGNGRHRSCCSACRVATGSIVSGAVRFWCHLLSSTGAQTNPLITKCKCCNRIDGSCRLGWALQLLINLKLLASI